MKKDFIARFLNPSAYKRKKYYEAMFSEQYDRWVLLHQHAYPEIVHYTPLFDQITYRNCAFGSSQKEALSLFPNPNIIYQNRKLKEHQLLLYIQETENSKVKSEMHFLNDELFFAKNVIERPTPANIKASKLALKEKYNLNASDSMSQQFEDPKGNKIIVKNNVRFEVCYVSGNEKYQEYIENRINMEKKDNKERTNYEDIF